MTMIAVSGVWTQALSGTPLGVAALGIAVGLLIWSVATDPNGTMPWLALVAVVVGISLNYIFLPLRAGQFPAINEGEPTTWQALLDVLNRVQYGKPPVTERQADLIGQFANYWQYWGWQFARDWGGFSRIATAVFTLLGLGGLAALVRHDRRAALAAGILLGTLSVILVYYLNFKYGFSIYPDRAGLAREVRERDYFFVASFAFFGTLVAVGFGALISWLAGAISEATGRPRATTWPLATPVLLLALVPLFGNRLTASRAHETTPRDFAIDLLESVEPYGILITAGDNDTFPLWFAQEVLGVRPDVTLANLSLMNTEWHLRQIRRRVTPRFDPARAAPLWRNERPTYPTNPVLDITEGTIDSLPEVMRAPGNTLRYDSVVVQLGSDVLLRQDLAAIFLIRDNIGKRPIFFSWSDGPFPDQTLGLSSYLITHGLVRKLSPVPVTEGGSVVMSAMGWIDLERTRNLLFNTYRWQSAARPRPRGWVDTPSASILSLYDLVYSGFSPVFAAHGDSVAAARADSIGRAVRNGLQRPFGLP